MDFEHSCGNPMKGLSKKICNGNNPNSCPQLDGLFNYMANWKGEELGNVNGDWGAHGKQHTSGDPVDLYAYCVKKV